MDTKELNAKINELFNKKIPNFFKVSLPNFFKNFPNMPLGKQIAYICIFGGVLLVVVSLFLF